METPPFSNPSHEPQHESEENVQTRNILVCIGQKDQHEGYLPEGISKAKKDQKTKTKTPGIDNLAFLAGNHYLDIQGISHDKRYTGSFLISEANQNDKFSELYFSCIGLIVVGKMIGQNKNISILVHTPVYDTHDEMFIHPLDERLKELKDKIEPETIDAIVFGGTIDKDKPESSESYEKGMSEISMIIEKQLTIKPRLVADPKSGLNDFDDVYFDTQQRRLYFMQNTSSEDTNLTPSNV